MSINEQDVKFRKSIVVTDTALNGGRKGAVQVVSGVRHALFPRVTRSERTVGIDRFRKQFMCNENADDEAAYGMLAWYEIPSTGGDHFYLRNGTQLDTQGDITSYDPLKVGCGNLALDVLAGALQVQITMERDDYIFPNGDYLHIANKVWTGVTIAADVRIGDSVQYNGVALEWQRIAYTDDIAYPKGLCVGANSVMTTDGSTKEEWPRIALNLTSDEVIGTGNGTQSPALSTLTNATRGICRKKGVDVNEPDHPVVVTAPAEGGGTMIARFKPSGELDAINSVNVISGELDMTDGTWTINITWAVNVQTGGSILCTYAENSFSYVGNTVTVDLDDMLANDYTSGLTTFVSACLYREEVKAWYGNVVSDSIGGGDYDYATYPILVYNDGSVEEEWEFTFSDAANFTCNGLNHYGYVGAGTTGTDFSPLNPDTGQPYFTMQAAGWVAGFVNGEHLTMDTSPSAFPMWLEELVPPGTVAEPDNLIVLGWYCE